MDYVVHLLILISIYGILALGLNLIVGFAGLVSVAHAAFFGLGAYTTAILISAYDVNFFLALILGMIVAAAAALFIGLVLSKFKEDFYVLGSLGFTVIVWSVFINWTVMTRGPLGIPGIDRPELFGLDFSDNTMFLALSLVLLLAVYVASEYVANSSFGRALKGIREDEEALQVFGYNVAHFKLAVFMIGAAFAAIAGALFATYITYIDPSTFVLAESIFILAIIILGGLANNHGALVGAAILVLLPELLRFLGFPTEVAAQMRQLIYGALLVLLMLFQPKGLYGEYKL